MRNTYISKFTLPQVDFVGRVTWQLLVEFDGVTRVAEDASNYEIIFAPIPHLVAVFPTVLDARTENLMLITGRALQAMTAIFLNEQRIPNGDVLHVSENEIRLRLQPWPSLSGSVAKLTVATTGRRSNAVAVTYSIGGLLLQTVLPGTTYDMATATSHIPVICGRVQAPTIMARVYNTSVLAESPTYSFAMRTSDMSLAKFWPLSTGTATAVAIADPENLFKDEEEFEDRVLHVLVSVSVNESVKYEKLLFISRRLKTNILGVTVMPSAQGLSMRNAPLVMEAHALSLRNCPDALGTRIEYEWRVNGTDAIAHTSETPSSLGDIAVPSVIGFGSRIIVPNDGLFSYSVTAVAKRNGTGTVISRAVSFGYGIVVRQRGRVDAVINGGLRSLSLPTGLSNFLVAVEVFDMRSVEDFKYEWKCTLTSDLNEPCPENLSPDQLGTTSDGSSFNISTVGVGEGINVEYTVTARSGLHVSDPVNLTLTVGSASSPVYPDTKLKAASALLEEVGDGVPQFECFEPVILSLLWDSAVKNTSFRLFKDGDDIDLLANVPDGFLLTHSGYWSPSNRTAHFFGIQRQVLQPGTYTLFSTLETNSSAEGFASWVFGVKRCSNLVLLEPAVTRGETNLTSFQLLTAQPLLQTPRLFSFSLTHESNPETKLFISNLPNSNNSTTFCEWGCTGEDAVSFQVSTPGRYEIHVDIFDPSGSFLLASATGKTVLVVEAAQPDSSRPESATPFVRNLQIARLHGDKTSFLDSVSFLEPETSLGNGFCRRAVEALSVLVASSWSFPFLNARIIWACAALLDLLDSSCDNDVTAIRQVAEEAVQRHVSDDLPSELLQPAMTAFYQSANAKISRMSGSSRLITMRQSSEDPVFTELRSSARTNLLLLLSTARECGYTGRLTVPFQSNLRIDISSGTPEVPVFDDYRVAINCFSGQVASIGPEPVLCRRCLGRQDSGKRVSGEQIYTTTEQHSSDIQTARKGTLSGPTVQNVVFRRISENGKLTLATSEKELTGCYQTRVSAYASEDIAPDALSVKNAQVPCDGAGAIVKFDVTGASENEASNQSTTVSLFEIGTDGRISAYVEGQLPVSVRMNVDSVKLRQCIFTLRGRVEGVENSTSVALAVSLAVVMGLLGFFFVGIVVWRQWNNYDDKYSVPASAAPWDAFEASASLTRSTADSSRLQSDELPAVMNEWETEYVPLPPRERVRGRMPISDESSGYDGDDSREPLDIVGEAGSPRFDQSRESMLTVTESYTTSSGDLGQYGITHYSASGFNTGVSPPPGAHTAAFAWSGRPSRRRSPR